MWKNALCGLAASAMATLTYADDASTNTNTATPMVNMLTAQQFVTDAAMGGMKEVRLSQMALEQSQNPEVKKFASRMVRDHSRVNEKLAKLAQDKGLILPATNTFAADDPAWNNPMITGSEQIKDAYLLKTNLALAAYATVKDLKSLSGHEFDVAYAKDMETNHVNTITEFEAASRLVPDPEFRKFAAETLPSLREHSRMAQKLADDLGHSQTAESAGDTNTSAAMESGMR